MRSLGFIARRLGALAVVLAVVSVLVFAVVQLLPGDVATEILGTSATPEDLAALRLKLGLTRPAPVRYAEWIGGVVRGDWGQSLLYQMPVRPLVLEGLGRSAVLAGLALLIAVPLSIGLGVVAALRRDRPLDHAISTLTLIALSLPEFVWGTLLILLLAYRFRIFPPSSMVDPQASLASQAARFVLPVLTLILALLAQMTRMTRASMIDAIRQPFTEAARLRGLRPRRVVAHALRNALLPTVGIVALNVGFLLGGIVIVETIFSYPGLGRLLVDSVNHRDVPMLQMATLVVASAYGLANLGADIVYAYLDPRIRY
ncbi:MAG TPA: ABC transporter permease [bacterium]|nr:ABC transporter permease [bacterium]